jgi:hypothetical protein
MGEVVSLLTLVKLAKFFSSLVHKRKGFTVEAKLKLPLFIYQRLVVLTNKKNRGDIPRRVIFHIRDQDN